MVAAHQGYLWNGECMQGCFLEMKPEGKKQTIDSLAKMTEL